MAALGAALNPTCSTVEPGLWCAGRDTHDRRQRILRLRQRAADLRRIAEEYSGNDPLLAATLAEVIRELEAEAAALEAGRNGD